MANLEYITQQLQTEIKFLEKGENKGTGIASIRATARLADVAISTLLGHFSKDRKNISKLAQTLINQGFQPFAFSETGIPDVAVAAILEYYAYDAGERCTEQAMLCCRAFMRIGVRAWMQDITGYQKPKEEKIDLQAFLIKQLPFEPKKWEVRFKPEFWQALDSLYGLERGQQACGSFISHWVYKYFPKEVLQRIAEINPLDANQSRKHRIHQNFDAELSKALDMQISLVTCNLIKAKNKYHFKRLMKGVKRYRFTTENSQALKGAN